MYFFCLLDVSRGLDVPLQGRLALHVKYDHTRVRSLEARFKCTNVR